MLTLGADVAANPSHIREVRRENDVTQEFDTRRQEHNGLLKQIETQLGVLRDTKAEADTRQQEILKHKETRDEFFSNYRKSKKSRKKPKAPASTTTQQTRLNSLDKKLIPRSKPSGPSSAALLV